MAGGYTMTCERCRGTTTVTEKQAGTVVACSACGRPDLVPTAYQAAKTSPDMPEFACPFADDEAAALSALDPSLVRYLQRATNRNRWEFGLAAALVRHAVTPVAAAVRSPPPAAGGTLRRWLASRDKSLATLGSLRLEILTLADDLGGIVDDDLPRALGRGRLRDLLEFHQRLVTLLDRVAAFHQQAVTTVLPGRAPFPRLRQILCAWSDHLCARLTDAAGHLQAIHETPGPFHLQTSFQASFAPPDFHEFILLLDAATASRPG